VGGNPTAGGTVPFRPKRGLESSEVKTSKLGEMTDENLPGKHDFTQVKYIPVG